MKSKKCRMTLLLIPILVALCMSPLVACAETIIPAAPGAIVDLTPILQAIVAVAASLITYRLLPWIKARTTETQRETMAAWIRTLVYAAEQLYKTGQIKDKLDYVEESLSDRGYKVDRDAIEAAVRELKLTDGIFVPRDAIEYAPLEYGTETEEMTDE